MSNNQECDVVPEFNHQHPEYCKIIESIAASTHHVLDAVGIDAETALDMDEAIEHLICKNLDQVAKIASADKAVGWISVDDELPDADLPVLVFAPGIDDYEIDFVDVCADTGDEWFANDRCRLITHWLPLPKPPANGESSDE
ncbi:DUF551 domain-containing protein [Marinobacter shengliensis]|uniref:DUF551 domain-containing protein n=1 Tax=Marinobacter shengliensis TaxID=1389223 RepID=UPI0014860032|nr:DUF551 domain-containing protein [Marinobacter shengliensis]